jgi:hypothetical protein
VPPLAVQLPPIYETLTCAAGSVQLTVTAALARTSDKIKNKNENERIRKKYLSCDIELSLSKKINE